MTFSSFELEMAIAKSKAQNVCKHLARAKAFTSSFDKIQSSLSPAFYVLVLMFNVFHHFWVSLGVSLGFARIIKFYDDDFFYAMQLIRLLYFQQIYWTSTNTHTANSQLKEYVGEDENVKCRNA